MVTLRITASTHEAEDIVQIDDWPEEEDLGDSDGDIVASRVFSSTVYRFSKNELIISTMLEPNLARSRMTKSNRPTEGNKTLTDMTFTGIFVEPRGPLTTHRNGA